jgi:hypothetical protein
LLLTSRFCEWYNSNSGHSGIWLFQFILVWLSVFNWNIATSSLQACAWLMMQKGILKGEKGGNSGKKKCGEWARVSNYTLFSARYSY